MNFSSSRGFTLLECLVSCTLSCIILSTTLILTGTITRTTYSLHQRARSERALIITQSHLESALLNLESHRLPVGWRVTHGCQIKLASGSLHPIAKLKTTSAPRSDSDCLSVQMLLPSHLAEIQDVKYQNGTWKILGCRSDKKERNYIEIRSHYAYGIEGLIQIAHGGSSLNTACYQVEGSKIDSLFTLSNNVRSLQTVIPVAREFTLYVDKSSHLRYTSHVGSRLLENQPLVDGVRSIAVSEQTTVSNQLIFSFKIRSTGRYSLAWDHIVRLPRSSFSEMALL